MNISKKALMSFLMALTSLISMAQPYYHVMKRDGSNLIEDTVYKYCLPDSRTILVFHPRTSSFHSYERGY